MTTDLTIQTKSNMRITPQDIKKYICPTASEKEIMLFINLCKSQGLNPFIREAYLIKYGTGAATMVVGKDVFTKRAMATPKFKGMSAGIIGEKQGELKQFTGSILPKDWSLAGGWAKVFVEGYLEPVEAQVSMAEYGSSQSTWKKMPATMIRKTALVQALREAFPEDLGGLYDSSEMGTDLPTLQPTPVHKLENIQEGEVTFESLGDDPPAYVSEAPVDCDDNDLPPWLDDSNAPADEPEDPASFCQFGKRKGMKWSDMDVGTLRGYQEYVAKNIADPNLAKFKDRNEALSLRLLNLIEDKEGM